MCSLLATWGSEPRTPPRDPPQVPERGNPRFVTFGMFLGPEEFRPNPLFGAPATPLSGGSEGPTGGRRVGERGSYGVP